MPHPGHVVPVQEGALSAVGMSQASDQRRRRSRALAPKSARIPAPMRIAPSKPVTGREPADPVDESGLGDVTGWVEVDAGVVVLEDGVADSDTLGADVDGSVPGDVGDSTGVESDGLGVGAERAGVFGDGVEQSASASWPRKGW